MNLVEGILDSLADGGESIIQIGEYLTYLEIKVDRDTLIATILVLVDTDRIAIEYPEIEKGQKVIDVAKIEDYWFELTSEGRREWDKIEVGL